jgi:hypothetical protein
VLSHVLDYGLVRVAKCLDTFRIGEASCRCAPTSPAQALAGMIFGRILFPCVKLALVELASGQPAGFQSETFDEDDLYEAMEGLNGH